MATTGPKSPTVASTTAEAPWSANPWVTPENLYGAGTANITAPTFDAGDQSEILRAYGFDFSAIPDGSTIDGVQVVIGGAYYATAICALSLAQLLSTGGALGGTNQYSTPTDLTTGASNYTKGGATDKWGNALDAAWVKNSNFGVGIGITVGASNNCDVYIDSVTMEVWYTPPASPTIIADNAGVTDAVVQKKTMVRPTADTEGVTDALAQTKQMVRAIGDTVGITDAEFHPGGATEYDRTPGDSLGITDGVVRKMTYQRNICRGNN